MPAGIYVITNTKNGRFYIGSAKDMRQRWYGHRSCLRRNKHRNIYLQRAWNKYGEDAFRFEVLLEVEDEKQLLDSEQLMIDELKATSRGRGYNICPSAHRAKLAEETKQRISKARTGRFTGEDNPFFGRTHSDEVRALLRAIKLGSTHTEQAKRKMSEARSGERHWAHGRSFTDEEKSRMSASMRKLKKPVEMYAKNGELVRTFDSINDAHRETGCNRTSIWMVCTGRLKSANGYCWRYAEPKQEPVLA